MSSWLLLPLSLLVVTAGAEALVRGASLLALRLGVSPLFVGLTVVGFGTSSPELAASLVATLDGATDVSVGNVVGSNILNVAVIIGITSLVHPIRIQLSAVRRDLLVAIGAAIVPWVAIAFGGALPRLAGAAFVATLITYLVASYRAGRRESEAERERVRGEVLDTVTGGGGPPAREAVGASTRARILSGWPFNLLLVGGGLLLLVQGSRLFVHSALDIARAVGASELVIGLTVIAAGTSLPELVTSLVAAYRRSTDIAVGNVIGSNIFNVFGILGVCALVRPQTLSFEVLVRDVPVMLVTTLALVPLIRSGGVISRREGAVLLLGYAIYLSALIVAG